VAKPFGVKIRDKLPKLLLINIALDSTKLAGVEICWPWFLSIFGFAGKLFG